MKAKWMKIKILQRIEFQIVLIFLNQKQRMSWMPRNQWMNLLSGGSYEISSNVLQRTFSERETLTEMRSHNLLESPIMNFLIIGVIGNY